MLGSKNPWIIIILKMINTQGLGVFIYKHHIFILFENIQCFVALKIKLVKVLITTLTFKISPKKLKEILALF